MPQIVSLIIYIVILALIYVLVSQLPLGPFGLIVKVLFILLAVLACLDVFGVVQGNYLPQIRI